MRSLKRADLIAVITIIWAFGSICAAAQGPADEPRSAAREAQETIAPRSIVLTVVDGGRIFAGEEEIALGDLAAGFAARGVSPREHVLLRTDRRVTYGDLMRLMDRLRAAGFTKVRLID